MLDTLLDEFFLDSTELRGAQTSPLHYVSKDDIPDLFSPRKLEVAFKSFKKGKAPRLDGIDTGVLQNLDGISLGRLALIYNMSLALGYVPERWRGAKAILIPKVAKSDYYSSPRSFRPISLTSFLFKGMEWVVAWHLEEIGVIDVLSRHQHAFRKGNSTSTCISEVVDNNESVILKGAPGSGGFLRY